MNILKKSDGLLTNSEVFDLFEENMRLRPKQQNQPPQQRFHHSNSLLQRDLVENQTLSYFKNVSTQLTTSQIKACLKQFKSLNINLTEAEWIQIANHAPASEVDIHIIVEECPERLNDDQIARILSVIRSVKSSSSATAAFAIENDRMEL